jgi:hypothetical protein
MMDTRLPAVYPVYFKNDKLSKKTVSLPCRSDVCISFLRGIALGLALVLPSGVVAIAQAPTRAQIASVVPAEDQLRESHSLPLAVLIWRELTVQCKDL